MPNGFVCGCVDDHEHRANYVPSIKWRRQILWFQKNLLVSMFHQVVFLWAGHHGVALITSQSLPATRPVLVPHEKDGKVQNNVFWLRERARKNTTKPCSSVNRPLRKVFTYFSLFPWNSGGTPSGDIDGSPWLLLSNLRSRPHAQGRWHLLPLPSKFNENIL